MNINLLSYKSYNSSIISPINFIGNNHPYKLFFIFNLCVASSLFISNYTLAKASIFLYLIYILNNNFIIIIILLFFLFYPLLFIFLIHPFIVSSFNNNIIHKSTFKGISIHNYVSIILSFISLFNLFIFFLFTIFPLISLFLVYIL